MPGERWPKWEKMFRGVGDQAGFQKTVRRRGPTIEGEDLIEVRGVEIKPGSLHFASRHVRSEANVGKRRRLAAVGMTGG
jgi:hypothetical protein